MLGFDNDDSNSAQESSLDEESNDSSDDFSASKLRTRKKMAENVVSRIQMAPEEAFEQGHMMDQKYPLNKLKISKIKSLSNFLICFLNLKTWYVLICFLNLKTWYAVEDKL